MNDNGSREEVMSLEAYVETHIADPAWRYYLLHQRGYAQLFDWTGPDREEAKRVKECCIVDDWLVAWHRGNWPFVGLESCSPPRPDCELTDATGRKTGVEVTELVDQETIERNKTSSYHWKEYTADELFDAVNKILIRKDGLFAAHADEIARQNYEKMILLMHTDEPALTPAFARATFADRRLREAAFFDQVFLMFGCPRKRHLNDNEAEFCQVVAISINRNRNKPIAD